MKIALIHNLKKGGQHRALYEEIKILSKKHVIDIYTLSTSDNSYFPFKDYVHKEVILKFDPPSHFPGSVISIYASLPFIYKEMAEEVEKGKYDIAYVNPDYLTQSPYILRYLKIPSLYHCAEVKREFYENIPRKSKIFNYYITLPFRLPIKWIDKRNAQNALKIMVNSRFSKSVVDSVYHTQAIVNHLGVDTDIFKNLSLPKKNQVLSVGTFSLLKGHDFIIRSLSLLPKEVRPKLVIVGQGGLEKNYLLNLAKSLSVDIEIKEDIKEDELVRVYNESKAYLFASLKEPFGLTLLEASACGTPVVSVNEGGASEILKNMPNAIFVKRDEKDFSEIILSILKEIHQKDSKKQIEKVVSEWSWKSHIERLEGIMKGIKI
ncbi:hypothetical protein A3D77_04670 [Candidatus Gottesmanbacteria bacterium RIFCSPHIGHO2_02_FULL_39_11]|uniref:Glycosyl transferase family 1 domain-containing protein n=1 Tax=Candidatus Gottesmanbacteria bacterium RIFCSPHIGHO2_02_FULL_39_11 TaxID=1798382 RepID=A0A1F5ZJS6_9BACT|nr:MAG: hypothetical protein A3D77_04670 [Candidatus Gottesmanbacteria bacterium RIFCSPHIGHO2_02_FULL_39_11]